MHGARVILVHRFCKLREPNFGETDGGWSLGI